jgi:hypothetical protein
MTRNFVIKSLYIALVFVIIWLIWNGTQKEYLSKKNEKQIKKDFDRMANLTNKYIKTYEQTGKKVSAKDSRNYNNLVINIKEKLKNEGTEGGKIAYKLDKTYLKKLPPKYRNMNDNKLRNIFSKDLPPTPLYPFELAGAVLHDLFVN